MKQVYAANPKTVVLLISSFPFAINWTQAHVPAILHMADDLSLQQHRVCNCRQRNHQHHGDLDDAQQQKNLEMVAHVSLYPS